MKGNKKMFSAITKKGLQEVGEQIASGLESEGLKWFKSFKNVGNPVNAINQKEYNGINWWTLGIAKMQNGFQTTNFATKYAWQQVGATIKEDQVKNGNKIFYYGQFKKKDATTDVEKLFRFLKISYVYNADQVDLTNSTWKMPAKKQNEVEDNESIEQFVNNQKGLKLRHTEEGRCYYSPLFDEVVMSNKINFSNTPNDTTASFEYYSTLFHELIHWTGSKKRLDRFTKNQKYFKDDSSLEYALEELIAEIGANLLCLKFDIQKTVNKNSIGYLKSWIQRLRNDNLFLIKSLTQSGQAVNCLKDNVESKQSQKVA